MKVIHRTQGAIGVTILCAALALTSGCSTVEGTGIGVAIGCGVGFAIGHAIGNEALGTILGCGVGAIAGGIIGQINEQQRAKLQAQSPQTLQTIQHNDDVYKQQQRQAAQAQQQTPGQAPQGQTQPAPTEAFTPLTVDDIKALGSAGVKKEVVIAEIERSKSVYTQADLTALRQSNPNIDPAIIESMKRRPS